MQSPNKRPQDKAERLYVSRLAALKWCACCQQPTDPEIHEIEQGDWFVAVPLCQPCHRGPLLGLHGQRRAWTQQKLDELGALSRTIRRMNT